MQSIVELTAYTRTSWASSPSLRVAALLAALVLAGCGDGDGNRGANPAPVAGTAVLFDLDADTSTAEGFYSLPYPSDLRLDAGHRADHAGFPMRPGNRLLQPVIGLVNDRVRWPLTPFAYFRFAAPLAERGVDDWIEAEPDGPVLLIGIDQGSRDYARLLPTIASTLPSDAYTPDNLLAVGAPAGVLLAPDATYAFVILRSLGDRNGAPLGVPESFARLRAGRQPDGALGERAAALYAPLWPALRAAGVDVDDVAAATVFSTGDVVAELAALGDALRTRHAVTIDNLHVDPDDGASHERFCELHGEARLPRFQRGLPPYNTEGRFEIDEDALPIAQAEEIVPLTITLPRTPMPAGGYPLVLYFHGTDGLSDQVVDRGPVREPGGPRAAGEGPAHVLAPHGFATFGAALPLNPERYTGPVGVSGRSYLNLNNLGAYPDTFRQMAIEQRLLLDALSRLEIDPATVEPCGLPVAAGDAYALDTGRLFALGQSLGGQIVNMVGATEPRIAGVVPTGSGGYWSLTILTAEFAPGVDSGPLVALLLGVAEIRNHLHPALQLVQSAFEPAEPLLYAARLARDPLSGHPSRSIYQPVGIDDPGFPNPIYAAMALASGTQQARENLHASLQRALAIGDLDGVLDYDVSGNARSLGGVTYTGVAVQYEADGLLDAHHIFAQLDEVKYQYGCFLRSMIGSGVGVVRHPAPIDTECSADTDG